jgi:hypothetical protein
MDQIKNDFDMDIHSEEYFENMYKVWLSRLASGQSADISIDEIYEKHSGEPLLGLWMAGIAKGWTNPVMLEHSRAIWIKKVLANHKLRTKVISGILVLYPKDPRLGAHKVMTSLNLTFQQTIEIYLEYDNMKAPEDDEGETEFIAQFHRIRGGIRVEKFFNVAKDRTHGIHMAVREFDMPFNLACKAYEAFNIWWEDFQKTPKMT